MPTARSQLLACCSATATGETVHDDRRPRRCRCRAATTCSTPPRRSRSRTSSASPDDAIRKGARRLRRRQAALHPRRRMERRHDLRRLRPPSGRDRRGAEGRARIDQGPGDRRGAAAPLHAAASLFEPFSTCFNDADTVIVARRLCRPARRRSTASTATRWSRRMRARGHRQVIALDGPAASSPASSRASRKPGDYVVLPRRRQHHAMGLRAAGRTYGAASKRACDDADIVADAADRACRELRGRLLANAAARDAHLVSRRRAGAGAVHAGRRGRSRVFPAEPAARHSGHGRRPRLEPDRARRRRRRAS